MKKKVLSALTALTLMGFIANPVAAKEYEVDSAHSKIGFSVTHLQLSEVEGRFNDFSGKFDWNADNPASSSLTFTAQTDSVNTDNAKRDSHLKTDDFFAADKYPELKFESTKIEKLSGERYNVTGNLTAHGVTKKISVPATIKGPVDLFGDGKQSLGFRATFKINRIDYGIGAGWKGGSDKVVGHDVFITVQGEAHE
ncbi:MAG TPA: polyisoprenoid-binding protein [Phycisphaerales bacterium]|nr:polyisoprenoid-binding protein [Phycisphaerales bacterium]